VTFESNFGKKTFQCVTSFRLGRGHTGTHIPSRTTHTPGLDVLYDVCLTWKWIMSILMILGLGPEWGIQQCSCTYKQPFNGQSPGLLKFLTVLYKKSPSQPLRTARLVFLAIFLITTKSQTNKDINKKST